MKSPANSFNCDIELYQHGNRVQRDIKAFGEFVWIAQFVGLIEKSQKVSIEFETNRAVVQQPIKLAYIVSNLSTWDTRQCAHGLQILFHRCNREDSTLYNLTS